MIDYTNNVRFPRRIHIATILLGVSLFAQAQFTDAPLTGLYPDGSTDNVQAGSVVLNDLEDHNWNYYSGVDMPNGGNTPIRSQNPRDVKIVYYGNGTNTVYYKENTFDRRPQPHRFTLNATTVRVGIKPQERLYHTFVYYATLDAANRVEGTGYYPYRAIANPFYVRPTEGTPPHVYTTNPENTVHWRGFYKWRIKSVSGGRVMRKDSTLLAAYVSGSIADTSMVDGDEELLFDPDTEYGMVVEFEALWAHARVRRAATRTGSNTVQPHADGDALGVERNFIVYDNGFYSVFPDGTDTVRNTAPFDSTTSVHEGRRNWGMKMNIPATHTSIYPNGTLDGYTPAYGNRFNSGIETWKTRASSWTGFAGGRAIPLGADTKFEYITTFNPSAPDNFLKNINTNPNTAYQALGFEGAYAVRGMLSCEGYNLTIGRGLVSQTTLDGSLYYHIRNYPSFLWVLGGGIGTRRWYPDTENTRAGYWRLHYSDHYHGTNSTDKQNTVAGQLRNQTDSLAAEAAAVDEGKSFRMTMRIESGYIGYPIGYYGWNEFISNAETRMSSPRVIFHGRKNQVRMILGNDFDRAQETQTFRETGKYDYMNCNLHIIRPPRAGNYWMRMPYQDINERVFELTIKSGFIGTEAYNRRFLSNGTLILTNQNPSGGIGGGGTFQYPRSIYGGVSNDDSRGKRLLTIEGGYIYSCVSGCGWDTLNAACTDPTDVSVVRIKGGEIIGAVFGSGNTYSPAGGDRQVIITGGKVRSFVAGSVNGTELRLQNNLVVDNYAGWHRGNTYVYIGGNSEIGGYQRHVTTSGTSAVGLNEYGGQYIYSADGNMGEDTTQIVGYRMQYHGINGAPNGNVFGAGCGLYPINGGFEGWASPYQFVRVGEVLNSTVVIADQAEIYGTVYGGGNYGHVRKLVIPPPSNPTAGESGDINYNPSEHYTPSNTGNTDLRILGGYIHRDVFGGSNSKYGERINILMTNGVVSGSLFGGCDTWGYIMQPITIDLLGGRIGGNVFGGGRGAETATFSSIRINVGHPDSTEAPTIGNLYGGSLMGKTCGGRVVTEHETLGLREGRLTDRWLGEQSTDGLRHPLPMWVSIDTNGMYDYYFGGSTSPMNRLGYPTTINFYKGDIRGDIYGGGKGLGLMYGTYPANVYGDVRVNIIGGEVNNVFGGNEDRGKPFGEVRVTIGHPDSVAASTLDGDKRHRHRPLVRGSVYGGGNQADYGLYFHSAPLPYSSALKIIMESGTVMGNVYGGGLGSSSTVSMPQEKDNATHVLIKHGYIHGNVYGGGDDGKVEGNTKVVIGE